MKASFIRLIPSSLLLVIITNALLLIINSKSVVHSFSVNKWTPMAPSFNMRTFENTKEVSRTIYRAEATDDVPDRKELPKVYIEYCTGCRWMFRATWLSQELLTTFQNELHSVTLIPSRPPAPGGMFVIALESETETVILWDRKAEGRFPEAKELKQKIRDVIAPNRDLGHSDIHFKTSSDNAPSKVKEGCEDCEDNKSMNNTVEIEAMDDEEASEMRNFFGVA